MDMRDVHNNHKKTLPPNIPAQKSITSTKRLPLAELFAYSSKMQRFLRLKVVLGC